MLNQIHFVRCKNGLLMVCGLIASLLSGFAAGQEAIPEPVPPAERLVGIAYANWFRTTPWHDVWGTPELGEYTSFDRAVIRQHAEWLHDAGVDFVWLDWSNNVGYFPGEGHGEGSGQETIEQSTQMLFEEYTKMENRPKISIFLGVTMFPEAVADGRLQRKADQVWEMYAGNPEYASLMQTYLGKPLLVVYVNTPSPWQEGTPDWDDPRFTVRWMTGFVTEQRNLRTPDLVSKHGYWSWEDRGKQTYTVHEGRPESMVVVASWRPRRPQAEPSQPGYIFEGGRRSGQTFRDQWARAREIGPKIVTVVSWNEWKRGEQPSPEVSKDIEPSKEFGRFYLKLMKVEIARFKGRE